MASKLKNLRLQTGYGLLAVVALAAAAFLLRAVPFDLASYLTWIGIGAGLLGLISVVRPLRFFGIQNRVIGALVAAVGIVVTTVCVLWPVSMTDATGEGQRLDSFLPEYRFTEYHKVFAGAPRGKIEEAIRQVSFADMPAADLLMRIRALAGGNAEGGAPDSTPILDMMTQPGTGFLPLDVSEPGELVYGMVGKPWSNEPPPPVRTPEEFLSFDEPGNIRVAFYLRVVEQGDGMFRVTTETRMLGNDPRAHRVFARYWRIIYPGSAITRKVWLGAIAAWAES